MSVSRLKLMTFDVTNTLLRVRVSPSHQYAEAAKLFGIEIPEKNLQDVYRLESRDSALIHGVLMSLQPVLCVLL